MPRAERPDTSPVSGVASDAELLSRALAQVIPIRGHARVVHEQPKKHGSLARRIARESHGPVQPPALSDVDRDPASTLEAYRRDGVPSEALRRLKRQGETVRECLDLHGLTRDQARAAVNHFVRSAAQTGVARLRIIHGQGYGSATGTAVLRQQTRHWLTQLPEVLGFVTPNARSGGKGAVLVLLKSGHGATTPR